MNIIIREEFKFADFGTMKLKTFSLNNIVTGTVT